MLLSIENRFINSSDNAALAIHVDSVERFNKSQKPSTIDISNK